MTSIAAIASPSTYIRAPAPSGTAKLRQMLASDAIAVRPIQPIPDEKQRRPKRDGDSSADAASETTTQAPEYEIRRNRGPAGDEVRSRPLGQPSGATDEARVGGGFRPDGPPPPPPPAPSSTAAASPSTGFLTQSIAQEAMGNGLHIEPWRAAISAYRRAGSGPRESLVSNVSV
ncbi:hypothetical protein [Azospirillum sp. sgz301742]